MRHEGTGGTMQRSPAYATVPCASGRCHARAFHEAGPPKPTKPRLLDRVRAAARLRHYSRRTEAAYVAWIRRYIFFHDKRHPAELGAAEVTRFLSSLAVEGRSPRPRRTRRWARCSSSIATSSSWTCRGSTASCERSARSAYPWS
jgi:integrase-like protein